MSTSTAVLTALIAGILGIFIVTLHFMGRIPICECGLGLWTSNAWGTDTSQHFADPYSTSHVLHGIIFYGVLRLFFTRASVRHLLLAALLMEIGWEILENSPIIIERYRAGTAALDYFGDSILNSFGDVLFALFGFWLAYRMPIAWTLAVIVAIELIMLWFFRDNLTLNVIMLVYPLDVIKEWQLAR